MLMHSTAWTCSYPWIASAHRYSVAYSGSLVGINPAAMCICMNNIAQSVPILMIVLPHSQRCSVLIAAPPPPA